jgi:hypothetical protein
MTWRGKFRQPTRDQSLRLHLVTSLYRSRGANIPEVFLPSPE